MKIITLCGSMKFQKEIMEIAEKLALEGNCVLTPIYPAIKNIELTDEQIEKILNSDLPIEEAVVKLIRKANSRGGTDNISIAYLKKESGEQ